MKHWAQVNMRTDFERNHCPECRMPNTAGDDDREPSWLWGLSYPCWTCGRPWSDFIHYPASKNMKRPSERFG